MSKEKDHATEHGLEMVLQELEGNPYRRFNIAFALMSIIPFLVFFYILAARLFTFDILCGDIGVIIFLSMIISFMGFYAGYRILKNIVNRIMYYAAKAKHSDQAKSEFVAYVSHELKNPLAVIKMHMANLRDGILGSVSDQQKKALENSQDIVERMNHMISDLLDLHKMEDGLAQMKRKLCNLPEILERQVKELELMAARKRIKVTKDFSGADLVIWADEDKIGRVVNNLLSNAIKYSPESGFVKLKTYRSDKYIKVEVEDTAPAIPHDRLEQIFDKFKRLDHKVEGTGLGLAIAKDIVEMHKGKIWAEANPSKGNKFIVVLPSDLRSNSRKNKP